MSRVSGRWKLGFLLALTTAILWGVLPIALKAVMETLDPITTTFFRFAIAAVLLTPYILSRRTRGTSALNPRRFRSATLLLQLLLAGLLLSGNYGLYILGLNRTTAEATQLMIQVAPMLLLVSGLWVFGERFSRGQWIGFATFFSGLLMFFSPRFHDVFVAMNAYGVGMLMVFLAAILWTGYAILQKFLLREFSSQETMLVFYWIGALSFLPFHRFQQPAPAFKPTVGTINFLRAQHPYCLRKFCRSHGAYRSIKGQHSFGPDTIDHLCTGAYNSQYRASCRTFEPTFNRRRNSSGGWFYGHRPE